MGMKLRYIGVLPHRAPKDIVAMMDYYTDLLKATGWVIHTHAIFVRNVPHAQPNKLFSIDGCMLMLYWHSIWSMGDPEGHVAYAIKLAKFNEIPFFNIGSAKEQLELEALIKGLP